MSQKTQCNSPECYIPPLFVVVEPPLLELLVVSPLVVVVAPPLLLLVVLVVLVVVVLVVVPEGMTSNAISTPGPWIVESAVNFTVTPEPKPGDAATA